VDVRLGRLGPARVSWPGKRPTRGTTSQRSGSGGTAVIEAPNRDVALTLAAKASKHCSRKVEVRPLLGD